MSAARGVESPPPDRSYRGRLAPSPTGFLHLGHARTFWIAQERARARGGTLVLRNEDLDLARCRAEFVSAMVEDLRWFGFEWQEGPDCGGPHGPYQQSQRRGLYLDCLGRLLETGLLYPCVCSRQDVLRSLQAPHQGDEEPVYPGACRPLAVPPAFPESGAGTMPAFWRTLPPFGRSSHPSGKPVNWRFRVPDGEAVSFFDEALGPQAFAAGREFGDFVVWRHDDMASYQLAVVADDHAMGITEVVRGSDLLVSTARQLLLYRALGWMPPAFFHAPLMTDDQGVRLAKRHDALSLRRLRAQGCSPVGLRETWQPRLPTTKRGSPFAAL